MILDELFANGFMCRGRSEQYTIRNDAGALAALFQHTQEQGKEQQLRFLRVRYRFQIIVDALCVDRSLERRIRQAHRKAIGNLILFRYAILIINLRIADRMQHEVHCRNAEHGVVCVKPRKCGACKMLPLLGGHGILVVATDVL